MQLCWVGKLTAAKLRKIPESTPSDDPRVCCIRDPRSSIVSASHDTPNTHRIHNKDGKRKEEEVVRPLSPPSLLLFVCVEHEKKQAMRFELVHDWNSL